MKAAESKERDDDELRALIKRVRAVELRTKKIVNAQGRGAYSSRFKGRGMAFSESRAYVAGDDPRHVDWNVTARLGENGELFVKQFIEERELTVLVGVDLSGSFSFGTGARTKRQLAAEVAALLAFSALSTGDKVGLSLFSDRPERMIKARKGRSHVLGLVREILSCVPKGKGTDLAGALHTISRLTKKRAIVCLITDLTDPAASGKAIESSVKDYLRTIEKPIRAISSRHDLIIVEVTDPAETALPDVGLLSMTDPETGKSALIDTSDKKVRARYKARMLKERQAIRENLSRLGAEHVVVSTGDDAGMALVKFLRRRALRA